MFLCHKANIERINEQHSQFSYHQLHNFISDSPWAHQPILDKLSQTAASTFNQEKDIGLHIDESGWRKKGKYSVGVGKQYCGNLGKTDNCQVAVFAALSQNDYSALVDTRLYLPKSWTDDQARCDKAKIPETERVFKTKLDLALEIITHQREIGVNFTYVSLDAFYGSSIPFTQNLDDMGMEFIGDVRINQKIYLNKPGLVLKEKKGRKGKQPTRLIPDQKPTTVGEYMDSLKEKDYKRFTIRNTAKRKLKVKAHAAKIYLYDQTKHIFVERTLILRKNLNKKASPTIDYAFTNMSIKQITLKQIIKRHAQRYFIEHSFKEAKSTLGMHQFQTRKWQSWYHQVCINMLMVLFMMLQKIKSFKLFPILSANDIKLLVALAFKDFFDKRKTIDMFYERYRKRQIDINYCYVHT